MPLIRGVVRISLWGAVPAMSAAFGPSFSRTCCARDTAGAGVNARVKRHKGCSGSNKAPTHRWSQKEMHDLVWGLAGSFSVGIFGGGRSAVTSSWGHGEFSRWYSGGERVDKPRKPGLTGTGDFIFNLDWWLWDDPANPGLISISRPQLLLYRNGEPKIYNLAV
jgi:hypothetical protein